MRERRTILLLAAGVLSATLGGVVWVGWLLGSAWIVQIVPGLAPMQPVTATSFVLLGGALLGLALERRAFVLGCGVLVAGLALAALLEHLFALDLGIDYAPGSAALQAGNLHPGRMTLSTALSFALLAATVVLRVSWRRRVSAARAVGALALAVVALATWVLCVYLTSLFFHSELWRFNQMALHSSAAFVLIGSAIFGATLLELRAARARRAARRRATQTPRPGRAAWFALGVSMALSVAAWFATAERLSENDEARFAALAQEVDFALKKRMNDYEQALHGARGLIYASTAVTGPEWKAYIAAQRIEARFPGVLGVGYAPRAGDGYRVHHLEPLPEHGAPLLGYDMFADPERRPAMERARDSAELAITMPLTLMQDRPSEAKTGVVMFLPVYRSSSVSPVEEGRRDAIQGFVFCSLRLRDLMTPLLAESGHEVSLRILDASEGSAAEVVYDGRALLPLEERAQPALLVLRRGVVVGGRVWTLELASRPAFHTGMPYQQPVAIMFLGSLLSVLVFAIAWSLSSTRVRALRIAKSIGGRLRDSERRYRDLVDHGRGLIWMHDLQGRMLYINPAASALLGVSRDEIEGRYVTEFLRPERAEQLAEYMHALQTTGRVSGDAGVVTREHGLRICHYDNLVQHNEQGPYVLAHAQDVTDLRNAQEALERANQEMRDMATRDALTGLANRRLLFEHLAQGIEQCRRSERMLAVLYLDLDKFKQVNDTQGHAKGDELLQKVACVLRECCRASDVPARLGGDEFVLMLTNLEDAHGAELVAAKIAARVPQAVAPIVAPIEVTASIGLALFPQDGVDPETLVQRADSAMYRAKREGSGSYVFCAQPKARE
jgi:diguanylate cyclase (GGDEF)-like protein/PAS domain S-box-containing protein